jgi:hypothetical protein
MFPAFLGNAIKICDAHTWLWNLNLTCHHHRSSPWTGAYDPPIEDGTAPSEALRKLEVAANEAFEVYRHMYVWVLESGQ